MKSLNVFFIFNIISFFNFITYIYSKETTFNFPTDTYELFDDETSSTYITINMENYSSITNEYFHILVNSQNSQISPIIIFSTIYNYPSINSSDIYSTQKIGDANLYLGKDSLKEKIYLNITCNIYPCSFNLYLSLVEKPLLYPGETYSYFVKDGKNNFTSFKIKSRKELYSSEILTETIKQILTISVSCSKRSDAYTDLFLFLKDKNETVVLNSNYNKGKKIIYSFIEQDLISEKGGNPDSEENYYLLDIISKDNQYITISVTSKEMIDEDTYTPITKVIPNEGGKYSILKNGLLKQECYSINQNLSNYENSLVFASISFYTKPLTYFFSQNKNNIIIPKQNSINIIFEKNKNNENNLYDDLCFALEKEDDEGIFKIEISETNDLFNKKNIYDPLNTGSIYVKSLPINGLTYYTHNPANRIYTQMNFNLKVIKGHIDMFVVRCDTFPDCSYKYEELLEESKIIENDKIIKPHIVNDMFSYSDYTKEGEIDLSPFNYKQNLMYVYCSDEAKTDLCQFEISFFTEKDRILLLNNDKFYQYMLEGEIDLYQINIPKSSDPFSKIQVILYTFTGDALYNAIGTNKNLTVTHDFVGGKEIYEYIPKEIYPINEQDLNIEFNIKAVTNTYYEVEYKIIRISYDDNKLENKVFFDEKYTFISNYITFKDQVKYINGNDENNKRYFVFENNKVEEQNPYFVQIFSLNCEIKVKRDEKNINRIGNIYQDLIETNDTYYENKYYIYEMNIESFENYGDEDSQIEKQCIIYISGEPLDKEETTYNNINKNKILLTENDPHEIILTKDIKSYRYLFPYLGYTKDSTSFMLIHINFDSKMSIKAKFYFDESNIKKEETMGRSGQILLNNKLINENCKDIEEICNIIIEINFFNVDKYDKTSWSSPNFQLFISSQNKIPSYLKNGEMRLDSVVLSNPYQYFYTDISKDSEGQIIANTKRGEGILFVRIYKKGTIDRKRSWGDIEIPVNQCSDCLVYDSFTHSVHFEKEHTKKCGNDGCLLIVTYKNNYSPSSNKDYLSAFTLLTRLYNKDKMKQSILDIPLKTYVYGAIEKRLLTYNYFKIYFPEDSEKIDFEIQCETCILYINKNETLPTPENHDLEYYSEGKFGVYGYVIKSSESIKDKYYTLRIESPIIASRYVTTYSLRVLLPIPSPMVNYNLIPVDSDQNANCDLSLKYNDGICYFIVYIDDNSKEVKNILAHVYTDFDLIDLEINANFIPKEIVERFDINEMISYLPESKDSNFSTANEFYQDYLLIDITQRKKNDYIIFGVKSEYSATVTFLCTYYNYKNSIRTNPNTVQLIKMESNDNLQLNLGSNNFYLIYLYSLYGTGEIKWYDENKIEKIHKFSEHELFSFTIYIADNENSIKSYGEDLAFYLWQDVREAEFFVMNEMDFNMRERFLYIQSIISLKYYCLLPLLKNEKTKKLNFEDLIYYFEINLPDELDINKDNNLIIEGSIINLEIINKIKIAKSDENIINPSNKITINYDLSTNSAFINLNSTYCEQIWNSLDDNNGNAYLYISIKQKEPKTFENGISGQMIVSFKNNTYYVIPPNQIISTQLDIKVNNINYYLYNLQLDGSYDKNKIVLDISSNVAINDNNIIYSLIDYNNINNLNENIIKKNSSNIEIDEKNSILIGGKYHLEFILKEKDTKGIYLCFFTDKNTIKENELKSINFIFKYSSYTPDYILPEYTIEKKITNITQSKTNIQIYLNKVIKKENSIQYYPKSVFIIRKINYENKISNEELSSISSLQSNYDILYLYKEDENDNGTLVIEFPYQKKDKEKYYISIICNLYEDGEKFAYQTFDSKDIIEVDEKGKKDKKDNNKTAMIILIITMVLVIVILAILIFLYINKKKMDNMNEKMLKVSFEKNESENYALYKDKDKVINQS